jgi:hypothetical protein
MECCCANGIVPLPAVVVETLVAAVELPEADGADVEEEEEVPFKAC